MVATVKTYKQFLSEADQKLTKIPVINKHGEVWAHQKGACKSEANAMKAVGGSVKWTKHPVHGWCWQATEQVGPRK